MATEETLDTGRGTLLYERIRQAYAGYEEQVQELLHPPGRSGLNVLLFKNRMLQDSKVNQELIDGVRGEVDELLALLGEEAPPADGGAAAEAVVRFMLLEAGRDCAPAANKFFSIASRTENSTYWMFSAMQTLAQPLLDHLSRPALEEIYDAYVQSVPNRSALPNQRNLKKQMQAMLEAGHGGNP